MDAAMLNWIRETLGCNIVNFFMDSLRGVEYAAQNGFSEVREERMKSVKEANFFERGAYQGWDNWLVVADNATLDYDEGEDLLDALDDNASKVKIKNAFIKQCPTVACRVLWSSESPRWLRDPPECFAAQTGRVASEPEFPVIERGFPFF